MNTKPKALPREGRFSQSKLDRWHKGWLERVLDSPSVEYPRYVPELYSAPFDRVPGWTSNTIYIPRMVKLYELEPTISNLLARSLDHVRQMQGRESRIFDSDPWMGDSVSLVQVGEWESRMIATASVCANPQVPAGWTWVGELYDIYRDENRLCVQARALRVDIAWRAPAAAATESSADEA